MDGYRAAASLLPAALRMAAEGLGEDGRDTCEELRLRLGRPMSALLAGREYPLATAAVTEGDLRAVAEAATGASLHAASEQLRNGYLTAPGGVRVGVCGTAVLGPGGVMEGVRHISSMSLRVPRERPGCADGIWPALTAGGFRSALIAGPPGAGKTTLLREIVRRLSEDGVRVAVADERGEIAGAWDGAPAFELGPCADVLTGTPKASAAAMLVRAMNPQVVAMDEIGGREDAAALLAAAGCGAMLLASAHGRRGEPLPRACRDLLDHGVFRRIVWIRADAGGRSCAVERAPCA